MGELKLGKFLLKTPAICGAITGFNLEEVETGILSAIKQGADLIELRFDNLREKKGWEKLIPTDVPTIFTNRPKREGGGFRGTEEKRVDFILDAVINGVSCVDIEFSTPKKLRNLVISEAKRLGVSVIISYHDFSKTPAVDKLIDFAKKMASARYGLVKIVTFAKGSVDSHRILDFLAQAQNQVSVPVLAFAMGEVGRVTRIIAPLMGSPFTYANVGKPTAPGQFEVAEAKKLLCTLMPGEI